MESETKNPNNLLSRCYLYIGIGALCKASSLRAKSSRDSFNTLAHESFTKLVSSFFFSIFDFVDDSFKFYILRCRQLDSGDHLVEYYLGLHAAFRSQIPLAVSHVKNALNLFPEHLPSLHLMILLLTAQKQMKEASELLDSALQDYPDNIWLHFLKIHLELHLQNTEVNEYGLLKFHYYL